MSDKSPRTNKISDDKDLDDLLDSALEDFDKYDNEEKSKDVGSSSNPTSKSTNEHSGLPDNFWDDEFIANQAKIFEEQMTSFFANNDGASVDQPSAEQIKLGFDKLKEAASMVAKQEVDAKADPTIVDNITEVLKGLKEGSELLDTPSDLLGMFSGLGMKDGDAENPFIPYMQGMMQSLLSAEILLPSMKELIEKYPKYLEDNKDKLDVKEIERYEKQLVLFKLVCADLETEKPDDSAEVKNERFKKVLDNMQKLQEYGEPPREILSIGSDGATNIPMFDPSALSDPSQCILM